MAEHVQAALDQMVAPLRDLTDRNIFSATEIRAIVTRRRESEYLLRRVAARKADFLRYIEQEMVLERLRELRTAKRKRDHRKSSQQQQGEEAENDVKSDKNNKREKEKEHIGDIHIVQHIHLLFVRAIRKFRSDLSLHLQHAEFCKQQRSWTRLGRVYAEALQVFPRQAGLWIEAASHEFFGPARNIRNARILLQRGLRLNEKSEEMWMQYFLLEMHYSQTLKGRRQILHQQQQSTEESAADDEERTMSFKEENEYTIPSIVVKNAFVAIPDSVKFRLQFMDACKQFPNTELLMNFIFEGIGKDFSSEPESWIARALFEAERQSQLLSSQENNDDDDGTMQRRTKRQKTQAVSDPVLEVLAEAIKEIKRDEMLLQTYRFVQGYWKELLHVDAEDSRVTAVKGFIDDLWKRAENCTSCDLAMEHTSYFIEIGQEEEALARIKSFCMTNKAVPAKAWFRWASLSPRENQKGILERALQKTSMDHTDHVEILLQLFGAQLEALESFSKLHDSLQRLLLLAPKTTKDILVQDTGLDFELSTVYDAYLAFLTYSYQQGGIRSARKVYTAVLFHSTIQCSEQQNADAVERFVRSCIELEKSGDSVVDKKKTLLRLYDKAISLFAGTPLEEVYREERNENAVFA